MRKQEGCSTEASSMTSLGHHLLLSEIPKNGSLDGITWFSPFPSTLPPQVKAEPGLGDKSLHGGTKALRGGLPSSTGDGDWQGPRRSCDHSSAWQADESRGAIPEPTPGSTTSQVENLSKSHNLSELRFQHL